MAWKYDAEDIIPPKLTTFSSVNFVVIFSLLLVVGFFLLFPKNQVIEQLATESGPAPISIVYLNSLVEDEPHNFYYRFLLTAQDIALGYWSAASSQLYFLEKNADKSNVDFQTRILWLNFKLNINLAYQRHPDTPARRVSEDKAYYYLTQLISRETSQDKLNYMAVSALGLNHPETAMVIYKKLLYLYPTQTKTMTAQIARTALMSCSYQLSGDLYFKAAHMAKTVPEIREYILLGLKAYQSNKLFEAGFDQLKSFKNPLIINNDMALFLTRYALAANRPDLAEKYITQVLSNQGENNTQREVSSTKSNSILSTKQGEI